MSGMRGFMLSFQALSVEVCSALFSLKAAQLEDLAFSHLIRYQK